uniref:non-specific serine/threonine protein kinase n=1 Tax=Opuntia streptacantha TaxID=393608 RepID=A0A7C9EUS4_OPUST
MSFYHLSLLLLLVALLPPSYPQVCQRFCGDIPLRFPFGGGPGCGDPRFTKYLSCNQRQLTFTTHSGSYIVTNVDYPNAVIQISDPSMSTCLCAQPSRGFSLDWDAPFSFDDSTVFALLDCSLESSPIYKGAVEGNTSTVPQCANRGTALCSSLFTCQPISQLNVPISTCCVYAPVDLGPAFEMDLQKLQCKAYTAVYSFEGQEGNPEAWKYGVALKYKFNVENDYPEDCRNCEKSSGACAYAGTYNSFVCNCPSGVNTTTDCYFQTTWSHGSRSKGSWLLCSLVAIMLWMLQ